MLFPEQVIVNALLSVADDEERSARFADLHRLLLNIVLVLVGVGWQDGASQGVPLLSQLVAELHQSLCLFNVALIAGLLCFGNEGGNFFAE